MSLDESPFNAAAIVQGDVQQWGTLLRLCFPSEQNADGGAAGLAQAFWQSWRRQSGLHNHLLEVLDPVRNLLTDAEAGWATMPDHPLWSALATLQEAGMGYQPELGRAGEKVLADLTRWVGALAAEGWPGLSAALQEPWNQEQKRLARLEQRLIDSERGQLRMRRAQQQAARLLNQQMAGRKLPAEVSAFLQNDWNRELQWCLLQHGDSGNEWRQRASLTSQLIASLQAPDDDDGRQRLYALIPEIGPQLRDLLAPRAHDTALLEQQLAAIERQHLQLLRGQPLVCSPVELIVNHDPWLGAAPRLSSDLVESVRACETGQWFLRRDSETRLKLALKLDDSEQLLFVNRLGLKAWQTSFEEFALALATGAVNALPVANGAAVLESLLEQWIARLEEQRQARSQALAEARRRADAQARARVEAKAKAIAEARALAEALPALEPVEASAPEDANQSIGEEPAAFAMEPESAPEPVVPDVPARSPQAGQAPTEHQLRGARQQTALLAVGSWVELDDEQGRSQRLKLAVKLPSSGKLIFVDREGSRRAEETHDRFAARLIDGSARILDQGRQFEDTLARVVNSLRRDRAKE